MNISLVLAFLFFIGSTLGWVMELLFRRFLSPHNPQRKWINPGFCTGPYLPLYGFGLCLLYVIASMERYDMIENPLWNKIALFAFAALAMTAIEYIAGILCLKLANVRLWDYSNIWGNIQGIICPKYSMIWACLAAIYYFFVHPYILNALTWLSQNLAFSFIIGFFFGLFVIDVAHASQLIIKLRRFAEENDVIIRYEAIKEHIRMKQELAAQKTHFFRSFHSEQPLNEHLKEMIETFETRIKKRIER